MLYKLENYIELTFDKFVRRRET